MRKELFKRIETKYILFDMIFLVMIVSNVLGFLVGYVSYGLIWPIFFYFVFDVVFIGLLIAGRLTIKIDEIMAVAMVVLNIVEFPFIFYFFGVNGLSFLILGVLSINIFLKGKTKIIIVVLTILVDIIIMAISYFNPQPFIDALAVNSEEISARYKNISADISYVITAIISTIMIYVVYMNNLRIENRNRELLDKISDMSKRDPLTYAFNSKFIEEYMDSLLKEKRNFTAAVYKIASIDHLNSNLGKQYIEILLIALCEILMESSKDKAIVARYSKESFILLFLDNSEVMDIVSDINLKLDSGAVANVIISRAIEKTNSDDTVEIFINRLGNKVKGFGDINGVKDVL